MINLATGVDFEEEDAESDISESAFFAPSFYEAWHEFYNVSYFDEKTQQQELLREQWFAGGRGCVDGDTLIETPNGSVKIRDFRGGIIRAFDGTRIVDAFACRPKRYTVEDLYEVVTDDGKRILCTDEHRFLTDKGWRRTDELTTDDSLCVCEENHTLHSPNAPSQDGKVFCGSLRSCCGGFREGLPLDVHRLTKTVVGLIYRYWHDFRQCDAPLLSGAETYQDVFQALNDALEHTRCDSHKDGSGRAEKHTHCGQCESHRSKRDCRTDDGDRCYGMSGSQICGMLFELLSEFCSSSRQFRRRTILDEHILKVVRLVLSSIGNRGSLADGLSSVSSCAQTDSAGTQILQVLCDTIQHRVDDSSFSDSIRFNEDCVIRDHHYTTMSGVSSIRLVKRDYYWDMFVPIYNNYVANGIVNHNSTKSSAVAAFIVLGLERDWQIAQDIRDGTNGMGLGPNHDRPNPKWYRYLTNAIVYRKVAATLADSVYNQFQQTMGDYMGETITDHWSFKKSPLRIVNTDSGQEIMFRGLDDPLKSKSIKPTRGYFKYLWLEELAEFRGMEEIRSVRQSILRGGKVFQSLYSYNPPETTSCWVNEEADTYVKGRKVYRSDYLSVPREWLGDDFFTEAELLKKRNFRQYRHEYLGEVTGNGGSIFENLIKRRITDEEIAHFCNLRYGCDFGFALDPAAVVFLEYDKTRRKIIVFDEIYEKGLLNSALARRIKEKVRSHDWVMCDSAEPKSIAELNAFGVNTLGAKKGPDSIEFGIKWLQSLFSIECDPDRTPKFYDEFKKYEFEKDTSGEFISRYPDENNHTIDACLCGNTRVWLGEGVKAEIRELVGKSGDAVSFDGVDFVKSRFKNVRLTRKNAEIVKVSVHGRGIVRCTADHRILTERGYVEAADLDVGVDRVVCFYGNETVDMVEMMSKREDVYDLEVPKYHNFIVNGGVCVHNCRYALENDMINGGLF